MAEVVTHELSEQVARRARKAAQRTGRPLAAVLAEWLDRGAAGEAVSPLLPGVDHHIFTPYGNEAAARVLLDALEKAEAAEAVAGPSQ